MADSDSQSTAGVREGQVIAGKYRIDRIVGEGGMGVVVAAHHLQLDERVAIKFLLPEALGNPEVVARFAREARAAVKIKSEHVARVVDVGTLETGAPYMVMEFLQGSDLSSWLAQKGMLSVELAVEFILQACEAIAEAHGIGIVHRDLKPANLFIVRPADGLYSVKVLDFGISKVGRLEPGFDMAMTKSSAVMGSPFYMSPEQMTSSRDVDARTDIWALGVVLYELLAGTVPFMGDALPEVCVKIATHPPPPLRAFRGDVPGGLEAIILRCLEKDPKRRYAHLAEFAVALAEFGPKRAKASAERILRVIHNAGLATHDLAIPPSSRAAQPGSSTQPAWGVTGLGPPSSRKAFAGVAIALALLATVPIVLFARKSSSPEASTSNGSGAPGASLALSATTAASATAAPMAPTAALPESEALAHPAAARAEVPAAAPAAPALQPARPQSASSAAASSSRRLPQAASPPLPSHAAIPAAHNCDPPFYFDASGIKRPKPECL